MTFNHEEEEKAVAEFLGRQADKINELNAQIHKEVEVFHAQHCSSFCNDDYQKIFAEAIFAEAFERRQKQITEEELKKRLN